ncbi:ABC transporter permease [Halobacteriales archaeon QS_1_68_20]|nr:MAG: ABC transporter permease [Halobacteriales archaeon QS_1_68_20]
MEYRRQVPAIQQIRTFMLRSLREMFRSKIALFWAIAWPIFWYGLTMAVFIGDLPQDVMAIVKATNAINFGMFGALTVGLVTFAENISSDLEEKRYRKLRSLPISPWADLTGRIFAGFAMAIVSFLALMVVGYLHGAAFQLRSLGSIPIVVLALFLYCVIGMAIAVIVVSVVNRGEYVTAITTTLLLILFFVTGYNGVQPGFVPADTRSIVNVLPNSLATRMEVYHLTELGQLDDIADSGLVPPELPGGPEHLLLLAGFAVALWGLSVAVMKYRIYDGEAGE